MLLGGAAGERLEPVGKVGRALFERPVLHALGDGVGDGGVERGGLAHRSEELRRDRLGQMAADRLLGEDVGAVAF